MTNLPEPASILYAFEDLHQAMVVDLGARGVSAEEIVDFGRRFDPQPFHVDAGAAQRSHFGGLVASGWHTASLTMRLLVDSFLSHSTSLGSPGVEKLRWARPVRPGDHLGAHVTVLQARPSQSKPEQGVVLVRVETHNQRGEVVMTMDATILFGRRNPIPPEP